MGATYLSMQLRTTDRDAAVAALEAIAVAKAASGLQFYVTEPVGGWLGIFPNFTPELEQTAKALSGQLVCLVVLLLSADEDDLYCMFFRDGKQLPWFKVGAPGNVEAKSATSSLPSWKRSPRYAMHRVGHDWSRFSRTLQA